MSVDVGTCALWPDLRSQDRGSLRHGNAELRHGMGNTELVAWFPQRLKVQENVNGHGC